MLCTYPAAINQSDLIYLYGAGSLKQFPTNGFHVLYNCNGFSPQSRKTFGGKTEKQHNMEKVGMQRRAAEEGSFSLRQVDMQWVSHTVYRSQQQNGDV